MHSPADPGRHGRIAITPATRVAELLDAWPELEDVLVAQAPAFRRLRNPVLRRTVARVASLEQAAGVGGVPVRELVAALRRAAGLDSDDEMGPGTADASTPPPTPEWLEDGRVRVHFVLDADLLLDRGEVPLGRVNALVQELPPGGILRVDSGFRPAPLVDALEKQGCTAFVRELPGGRFETFFRRPDGGR